MAIVRYAGNRMTGVSGDTKPTTNLITGTTFHETNTDDLYIWDSDSWNIVAGNTIAQTLSNKTYSDHITVAEISTPGTPSSGYGAIYAKSDNKLYFKNDAGTEVDLTNQASGGEANQNAWNTITVSGQDNVVADSATDTLTLAAGSNITLTTNASNDTVTIASSGATQNLFQTIAVSGQSDVVADSATDTLTLVGAGGTTITTNAGSDTVTISSSATQNLFQTIAVSGQDNVVADTTTDTLTFAGAGGMTITTNASNDTVTFTSSGGGTLTVTDNESTNENNLITFVADAATSTGAHGLEMDGDFHYNPSTGRLTATQLAGTLQTAAQTNITSVGALDGGSITSGFTSIDVGSGAITTTGTITAGNLNVTGTTTTVNSTNTTISDRLIELASGASDSTTDAGIIVERGSTGDNAIMAWDESTDRFVFGTTTATGASTGNLTIADGTVQSGTFIGNLTGNVTGTADTATEATNVTAVANNSTNETVYPTFVDGATGTQGIETDTGLTYNPSTGLLTTATVSTTQVDITAQGDLRLQDTTGGQYVGFQAPGTVSSSVLWTLPAADGSANYVLATNGSGTLSWAENTGGGGTPGGSNYQIQYNNSSAFGGASNVEIRSNTLALKEQSAPSAVSGYGQVYTKTDNNLYYKDDGGTESQLSGNKASNFFGVKAYLNADLNISNNSATVLGDSSGSWTEVYDVGTWHDASTNPDRINFPTIGYYLVNLTHRWAINSSGHREIKAIHHSGGSSSDILLDRLSDVGFTTPYSTSSTVVYASTASDYVTVSAYQNSGATLSLEGGTDEDTSITISRLDHAVNNSSTAIAKARLSTATTAISHNTETALTFNTDVIDTNTFHDTSSNTHRFVAPTAGYYLIKCKATLDGASGDANYDIRLRIKDSNGDEIAEEYATHGTFDTTYVTVSVSGVAYLAANAWVAGYLTHTRDANTNLIGGTEEFTFFEMVRLDGNVNSAVSDLTDTNITSPADAALLIYDTGTSKWRDGVIGGDATMSDTGALTIAAGAVEGTMLNANTVDDSSIQLASNTLNVKAAGITGTMLNTNVADDSSIELTSNTLNIKATGVTNAMLAGSIAVSKTALVAGTGITLSTNTLNVDAAQTQITSVGALNAGSITSGFGAIDTGSSNITTTGTISAGNLTVTGTTTTVNSTVVTVDDPIFTIGGDTAPGSDDNKDRGIEFRWHNGSAAKVGFFGFDDSTGKFTFIPDATNSSEVFSGTAGTVVATTFEGALTGNVTGNVQGNVTGNLTGQVSTAAQTSITSIANLVTVGTIGTGVWQGTAVTTAYGGTGLASYTAGDLVYYATGTTLTKLAKGTAGQALKMNSGATAPEWVDAGGAADQVIVEVAQSSHNFAVGDILRLSGDDTYAKAQADSAVNAEVIGIVKTVTDTNNFVMITNGHITTAAAVPNQAAGTVLFLDPDNEGELTITEPTTEGDISKPVAVITNANDSMLFINFRGKEVGADAITTEKLQSTVTYASHGLAVSDVVKSSGVNGKYDKAIATSAAGAETVGIVTAVSGNNVTIAWGGVVDVAAAVPDVAAGTVVFLSDSTAGDLTATEPTTAGRISKPFAVVTNQNTEMLLLNLRGEVISSSSANNAPDDAQYVVLAASSDLTVERVLTGGSGITLTDGGAGSTITVANDLVTAGGNIGGHLLPAAQNTHDLGSTSYQWRNIYTQDFHLNNTLRETGNSIDGTKGDWTIQEGTEDLFIVNNKTGKKYKFNLTEVS